MEKKFRLTLVLEDIQRQNWGFLCQFDSESGIYDFSLVTLSQCRKVVEEETKRIWEQRAVRPFNNPMWLVFEESEAYLRNIRGQASENVFRIIHQGRNLGVGAILITTDLALLDASVIRLCEVRFHGSLGIEENAKRKFRAYYGKDWTRIAFEGLGVGDFIRLRNKKLDVIHVPEFKTTHAPRQLSRFKREEPKPRKSYEAILWERAFGKQSKTAFRLKA